MQKNLFSSFSMGDLTLANRMVMAPMTRNRANDAGAPTAMMIEHYRQRASAGPDHLGIIADFASGCRLSPHAGYVHA